MAALMLKTLLLLIAWSVPHKAFIGVSRSPTLKTGTHLAALQQRLEDANSSPSHRIRLKVSPLIGGPSWLPVHVKVALLMHPTQSVEYEWDFVPVNATDETTFRQLMSLQKVPAEIRWRAFEPKSATRKVVRNFRRQDTLIQKANQFAESYNRDLHLLFNNCWTFALQLYWKLVFETNNDTKR